MAVQHETSEASLRKRHQEAVNELTDQLEQSNKHRAKSVSLCMRDIFKVHDKTKLASHESWVENFWRPVPLLFSILKRFLAFY